MTKKKPNPRQLFRLEQKFCDYRLYLRDDKQAYCKHKDKKDDRCTTMDKCCLKN